MDIIFFPVYECVSDNYSCVLHVCVCDSKFQNPLVRQRTFSWLSDYFVLFFPELIEMLYLHGLLSLKYAQTVYHYQLSQGRI